MTDLKNNQLPHETARISHLDSIRAIAIIMVVSVHTLSYCIPLPPLHYEVIAFLVQVAVPIFFLVDGYIFANRTSRSKTYRYQNYIVKSFFRLVVPWVIFTLIYTLSRYLFEISGFLENKLIVGQNFQNIAISAYGSVFSSQMYFLLSLFLIRLISPVLKIIFINKNYHITLLLFIIYLIGYKFSFPTIRHYLHIPEGQEPITHAIWGLQFYIIGIIIFKTSLVTDIKKLFIPSLILLTLLLYIQNNFYEINTRLIQYLYLLAIFFLFTAFKKTAPVIILIGRNTMGIYLIHVPIILKAVSLVLNKIVYIPILSFTTILISTITLSVITSLIINRIPYGSIIFGVPKKNLH